MVGSANKIGIQTIILRVNTRKPSLQLNVKFIIIKAVNCHKLSLKKLEITRIQIASNSTTLLDKSYTR